MWPYLPDALLLLDEESNCSCKLTAIEAASLFVIMLMIRLQQLQLSCLALE